MSLSTGGQPKRRAMFAAAMVLALALAALLGPMVYDENEGEDEMGGAHGRPHRSSGSATGPDCFIG